ncbi:interferon-induced guanylate-binding protein 2-like protein [Dinothrombium tinctorium]|uniref:Interferon-induced guanylate-binding protein 2-like protein n=1 Tax=Dinothrombium tinctorium TaxID=1965070 RepID=A0A3S5WGQ8_9ACAR|nr:interferon-induced guanylate-binding protein 2-like protein [Dinothrombium tinctorium]RWS07006.1 interferon-induced guanylate-binding protein 2-like protein [Dinothrombium tinctorium]
MNSLFSSLVLCLICSFTVCDTNGVKESEGKQSASNAVFTDKPIQLVAPSNDHKSLIVIKDNLKLLSQIRGPVAVVSVVGKFHSGKSFLMNQLMRKSNGFGIGPLVSPMTMGIWMWGKPAVMTLASGLKTSVVFLDTEGFAANNVSENYDAKIFAVATLLSSHLLYNSVKIIDQSEIDYLEVLARRTQLFALRSQMSRSKWTDNFDENLLSFPPLIWVVQDFYQDTLDGETPQEWLHRLMLTHTREAEDYQISILDIFKSVDCHTLFLPATTKKLLNNLSLASENDLTPDYRQDRDELIKKLQQQITPKEKSNKPINGAELAFLLEVLVNAANEGSLADIPTRWHSFVDRLKQTATEDCLKFYEEELKTFLSEKHKGQPIKSSILTDWHKQTEQRAIELLRHLLQGLDEALQQALRSLRHQIELIFENSRELNDKKVKLKIIEIHNNIEIQSEDLLRRVNLPIPSLELKKESDLILQRMKKSFSEEIKHFTESSAEIPFVNDIEKSIKRIISNIELLNNQKIDQFLEDSAKEATKKFYSIGKSGETNVRKPALLKKVLDEAFESAILIYKQMTSKFDKENSYASRLSFFKETLSKKQKEIENENEQLAIKHMKAESTKLLDSFRERTSSQFIALPVNDTYLETRLRLEVSKVIKDYEEILGEFVVYISYVNILEDLKQKLQSVCALRREENIQAFTKEVKQPLEMAKRLILLSADKYTTVFSFKQFIRSVCLLNLDEGKPKFWPLSLKSQIIENFMEKDEELQESLKSKEGLFSAILGFFQWLLWLFKLA